MFEQLLSKSRFQKGQEEPVHRNLRSLLLRWLIGEINIIPACSAFW